MSAAVAALPASDERKTAGPDDIPAEELSEMLCRLIRWPWADPVGGVDMASLLRGMIGVELSDLPNEDKVLQTSDTLRIDRHSLAAAIRLPMTREERLALAALYCAHELVHVQQGIGNVEVVAAIPATGAEQTLMQLDLAADHAAAAIVHTAFPRWRLKWLKDLQGRSLVAFPVSPFNIAAGRARKAHRLVSLRLDYLARETQTIQPKAFADRYAFADFGPAGGRLLVMLSGPLCSVAMVAPLAAAEAALLHSAADAGLDDARLARIDSILRKALDSPGPA